MVEPTARRWLVAAAAFGLAGAVVGCGGDDRRPSATATAPGAPQPTVPSGQRPPRPAVPRAPAQEDVAPGGSQPVRVPATFTLRGGTLTPRTVSIPPFLAIEVSVADTGGGGPQTVIIAAERRFRLRLPAGGRASLTLPGQPPGRYPVTAGRARALLIVGGEPGP